MKEAKAHIISQLQKEINSMQGFKPSTGNHKPVVELGPVNDAFHDGEFPLAGVHEFLCTQAEDKAATCGFIGGILSSLMHKGAVSIWISSKRSLFPPGLKAFGIDPDKMIFIDLKNETDVLWAIEESLKSGGLAAVIGEVGELSFNNSRRLQLAVEKSGVTGFILRPASKLTTTACITRWKIISASTFLPDDMPGLGFPRWDIQLLRVRNGKPGRWQIEWKAGKFTVIPPATTSIEEQQKQAV